jgi:protein phosphatase
MTYRARPGDVFILCSDGLTTMVKEDRIADILRESSTLDEAADSLIAEANEAGGRDNITVVAFRVDDEEAAVRADEGHTLVGPAAEEAGLTAAGVEAAAAEGRAGRTREPAIAARGGAAAPKRRNWPRRTAKVLVVVLITVGLAAAAVWGVRQIYFLGTDSGGRLALYRGLPYTLPLGVNLYSEVYASPVQVNSIPPNRRNSATDHTLRFHDDAASLLQDLQAAAERRTGREQAAANRAQSGGGKQPSGGGQGSKPAGAGGKQPSGGGGSGGGGSGGGSGGSAGGGSTNKGGGNG